MKHRWHYLTGRFDRVDDRCNDGRTIARSTLYRCCDCGAVEEFDPHFPTDERFWVALDAVTHRDREECGSEPPPPAPLHGKAT
jgi:hypothetical protein